MSYKEKLKQFRESRRQDELNDFFRKKRNYAKGSSFQTGYLPPLQTPDLQMLKKIANFSLSEEQIERLYHEGWMNKLWPFMRKEYQNSEEQLFSSSALCNLTIIRQQQPPSKEISQNIISILEGKCILIIDNVLVIIFNLIYDHQNWRDFLVNQKNLVGLLVNLFESEDLSERNLVNLLKAIYKTIQKAENNQSFLVFNEPIANMICSTVTLNQQLTFAGLLILSEISKMFEKEIVSQAIESRLIAKLGPLVQFFTEDKLTEMFFNFTIICCSSLARSDFTTHLMPLIRNQFEKQGSNQQKACNLLYNGLESMKISPFQFWLDPIHLKLLNEFENTDDEELLVEYSYLFSLCLLNVSLEINQKDQIVYCLKRSLHKMQNNVQVQGYIQETLQHYQGIYGYQ